MGIRMTGSTGSVTFAIPRVDFGLHDTATHHKQAAQRLHNRPRAVPTAAVTEGHITSAGEEMSDRVPRGGADSELQVPQHHRVIISMSNSQKDSQNNSISSATFVSASKCVV